jgi:molybdate/tungstate transport system ATP-binding protein
VLLLDEPLSALDSQTKSHLRDGLTKVNKEYGITMVHVTHDQTEGIILADRIGVLMHGQLMQVGDSKEIFNRPVNEEMASFVGMENILYGSVVGSDEGIAEVRTTDGDTIFALTDLSEGEVRVYVRPEDILLSTEECDSSAQNHVLSSIASLQDMGPLVRVTLANGIVSLVTKRALHSMGLVVGLELYAAFKATSAHVAKD